MRDIATIGATCLRLLFPPHKCSTVGGACPMAKPTVLREFAKQYARVKHG
jgi:hypothetical protein